MPILNVRFRLAAAVASLALLTGCGADSGDALTSSPAAPLARDLPTYDAYVLASAENNPLFADVYAIRFQPFAIDRITTNKRISSVSADKDQVLVAAADQNVDRLAVVSGSGELLPVPGLGRPHAFEPLVVDGVMYYQDIDEAKRKDDNRFFSYDLSRQTKKLLFRSAEDYYGLAPLSGGRLIYTTADEKDASEVVVRNKAGRERSISLGADGGNVGALGRDWFAHAVAEVDELGESRIIGLRLLDPDTGRTKMIPGLQAVTWSPDGTRLLARRINFPTDSALVLLDPARPNAVVDVATVPGLAIYAGSWVRGAAVR
ncbi:MAG: hypothetical protein ACT4PP_08000 [Sporichthyaceae bacterium]